MADPITTVSVCSGVALLDEAVRAGCEYFGWEHRVAAYCEWEAYAQTTVLARMEESSLESAFIWGGDLAEFPGRRFAGLVDGITAGFPCQPWSAAGKQLGTSDDRWLWPLIVRLIDDVEPGFVFLENVSALIAGGGLEHVLSDLAARGFDAEWCCLTAEAVGASHRRERVFILAHRTGWREWMRQRLETAIGAGSESGTQGCREGMAYAQESRSGRIPESGDRTADRHANGSNANVGDSGQPASERHAGAVPATKAKRRRKRLVNGNLLVGPEPSGADVAVAGSDGGRLSQPRRRSSGRVAVGWAGGELFAPGPGADWSGIPEALWPATEPRFRVLVDGSPVVLDESRADQLRCSGNGVVPLQGAVAFVSLVNRVIERYGKQEKAR